jgi:Cu2+-exporting ATPase
VFGGVGRSLESASVNLLSPGLDALPELLGDARRAVRVARSNLVWAFAYNGIGLSLAASGRLTPIFAATAMAASSLIVVLNSGRLVRGRVANSAAPLDLSDQPAVGAG